MDKKYLGQKIVRLTGSQESRAWRKACSLTLPAMEVRVQIAAFDWSTPLQSAHHYAHYCSTTKVRYSTLLSSALLCSPLN